MKEAVIVATARTPIGKAYRGGFNSLGGASLGAASVAEVVKRAGIDPARVEDVIMGCAMQQGATGSNVARQIAIRAGLPITTSGMTMDRQCSSGLMAVATAAKQVMYDGMECVIGGGLESISLVQNENMNRHRLVDDGLMAIEPDYFMPMLQTAEVMACSPSSAPLPPMRRASSPMNWCRLPASARCGTRRRATHPRRMARLPPTRACAPPHWKAWRGSRP
jgi:acetyl-CoA C-acetyltransferase